MNKPHVHKDLIIAWANGAEIQIETTSEFDPDVPRWVDQSTPTWGKLRNYRIKPREFKEGAWYPVIHNKCTFVMRYRKDYDGFDWNLRWGGVPLAVEQAQWIGEEIKIDWPEE